MAQAGAAAGGEVVVAGGPGAGRDEEVPDVRFLMKPRERELFSQITSQEQEQLFVNLLRSNNVKQAELELSYRISDAMITQQPPVVALFRRGAALVVSSYRKRRRAIFLMMMQRSYGGCKNPKISVPFKYSNPAQLQGDIRSVKNQIRILYAELLDVCQQLKVMSQVPLTIPEVLHDPVEIPKAKK